MKREKSDFADYTEKLIPTRVTITKQRGDITFVFDINGFRGAETGQIYYKGKDMLEVEQLLKANNVVRGQNIPNLGWVCEFTTPETVVGESITTGTVISVLREAKIQPETQGTITVRQVG